MPYEFCMRADEGTEYGPPEAVIRTDFGAAEQVGNEAALALRPTDPRAMAVLIPPDLRTFRRGVEGETRALFLGLAGVSLVIGALGISNTALISVIERRTEIGLRRAVGASRWAIAGQFMVESAVFGLVGGALGTIVGIDVVATIALTRDWLVVLHPQLVAAGPVTGVAVGVLAGIYPAWAASRIAPATTLRG
jgi:putative ABC transport system permease protein